MTDMITVALNMKSKVNQDTRPFMRYVFQSPRSEFIVGAIIPIINQGSYRNGDYTVKSVSDDIVELEKFI